MSEVSPVEGKDTPAEIAAATDLLIEAALWLADDVLNPSPSRLLASKPDARKIVALGLRLMRDRISSRVEDPILQPDPELVALAADFIARVYADTGQKPLMIFENGIYLGVMRSFAGQVISDAVGYRPKRRRPAPASR